MIDSRAKGRTAEMNAKKELRKLTGLQWERTPMSGALSAVHKLKGDVYIPDTKIKYCVEIKHYKDDHLTSKIITSKRPQIEIWWEQTIRESRQMDKEPLLVFKFDRSKWFAGFSNWDLTVDWQDSGKKFITINNLIDDEDYNDIYICSLVDFCAMESFLE